MDVKRLVRGPLPWLLAIALVVLFVVQLFSGVSDFKTRPLSDLQGYIDSGQVTSATIKDKEQQLQVVTASGDKFQSSFAIDQATPLANELKAAGNHPSYKVQVSRDNVLISVLLNVGPLVLLVLVFFFLLNQMQGGGNKVMNFGKSKAKTYNKDMPKTTFADVAGADEAVEELQEVKEFLENPAKFQAVGAKIPKGVLLYGPPGTGKTLLARAVAGEAGVPFYSISGSDFVEMFVGVGASRVRDLFEQAKNNAPAIIFVDEIDAVGRHRGAGLGGGHDEREQTLNQLLVEMDGFDVKGGVILIAATNRPDILDPALLRPGRFDRQIAVDRPDLPGRKAVLEVHAKGKPIDSSVDLTVIARRTPGFTGADLANVLNEAALLTARQGGSQIDANTLEESIDRVVAGPQRRTRVMSEKEKKITAYHEVGHALVAHALPNTDPVHKITILPRGRALGYTMVLPTEDKFSQTRAEMLDSLAYALGGRAAEELVFADPTTGAANDIEKATGTARAMITQFGMSETLGPLKFGQESGEVFLGRDMGHQRDYSEAVAAEIDREVRVLIDQAHDEAWNILVEYRDVLDDAVLKLLDQETLSKDEILEVFAPVSKRPLRPAWHGNPNRAPASRPPVLTAVELSQLGPADVAGLASSRPAGSNGGSSNGGGGNGSNGANGSARRPVADPEPGPTTEAPAPAAAPFVDTQTRARAAATSRRRTAPAAEPAQDAEPADEPAPPARTAPRRTPASRVTAPPRAARSRSSAASAAARAEAAPAAPAAPARPRTTAPRPAPTPADSADAAAPRAARRAPAKAPGATGSAAPRRARRNSSTEPNA
jgi:cell division protease FtsH